MDESRNGTDGLNCRTKCSCNAVPFVLGIAVALAFGWWVFPGLVLSEKTQPVYFTHKTHVETAGISCADCHSFTEDGYFKGLPKLDACNSCHADLDSLQTPDPTDKATKKAREAEVAFIKEYVIPEKEVEWRVHQKQPDNVFFSHAAHFQKCYDCHTTMKGRLNFGTPENPQKLCQTCHVALDELDKNPAVQENVLTGYSKTTMKMWQCEGCHAYPGHFSNDGKGRTNANNACFTCHK